MHCTRSCCFFMTEGSSSPLPAGACFHEPRANTNARLQPPCGLVCTLSLPVCSPAHHQQNHMCLMCCTGYCSLATLNRTAWCYDDFYPNKKTQLKSCVKQAAVPEKFCDNACTIDCGSA